LGDLALGQVEFAQIIVSNCQLRVGAQHRQIIPFGLLEISFREKRIGKAEFSVGIIRLDSEKRPKLADVFIILAKYGKESCVAVMRVG
jgi:hypothetical protein